MNVLSLFSGAAMFDLGLQRAGMNIIAQVEIDTKAQAVERRHFPDSHKFGDVTHVTRNSFTESIDLVVGGSPCQGFSVAGKQNGLTDERSNLWYEYHRILTEFKPYWFIFENVPGILSSGPDCPYTGDTRKGIDFAIVLAGLTGVVPSIPETSWKNAGVANGPFYNIAWRILDAQNWGVAQRRRRVFIVGCLAGQPGSPAEILFERDCLSGYSEPRRKARQATAARSARSARIAGNRADVMGNGGDYVRTYTISGFAEYKRDSISTTMRAVDAKAPHTLALDCRNNAVSDSVTPTLQAKANGGYSLNAQPVIAFNWDAGANNGGSAGARLRQHKQFRRLTPIECERLQGLPDNWTQWGIDESGPRVEMSDTARYTQIGNGGCVNVLEWIGKRIMKQVEELKHENERDSAMYQTARKNDAKTHDTHYKNVRGKVARRESAE